MRSLGVNVYSVVIKQNGSLFSGSSGASSRPLTNAENIALQHSHDCSCVTCRSCSICNDTFKNRTGLAIHMRKRHDLNRYVSCPIFVFNSFRNSTPQIKIEPKLGRHGEATCSGVNPNCTCRACIECHICGQLAVSKVNSSC